MMDKTLYIRKLKTHSSSRLGMRKSNDGTAFEKQYELTNHLGNVLAVISDTKNADGTAKIVSASDYYPFGMMMPVRTLQSEGYRYGFGGHEKDDEVSGNGNYISFGDYGYNPRLGRRFGLDPIDNPNISNYSIFNNNPIYFVDADGKFPMGVHYSMVKQSLKGTKIGLTKRIALLYGTSWRADWINSANSSIHLDNLSGYEAIANGYNTAVSKYNEAMAQGNFVDAGEALHTIADFYSHSTYLNLYEEYAKDNKIDLDPNNIPTFEEAMSNPDLKQFLEERGDEFRTGVYESTGNDIISKIKDYNVDSNSIDPLSHGQTNMDSDKSPKGSQEFTSGNTNSETAKRTAQKDLNNRLQPDEGQ